MTEFFINTLVAVLTGIAGYFTGRRKNVADARITEMDAVEKAISIWRNLSENQQARYDTLIIKVDQMEKELDGLREDNARLRRENKELIRQIKVLTNAT